MIHNNNIPQGYKQTELGIIPKDWEVISIKERGCLVKDGINPMLSPNVSFWEYSMPAFDNGKQPTLSLGEEMHSNRTIIRDTVLLFNKLNVRQQRVWFVESPSVDSVCSMEFLPYVSKSINLEFLYHYLKTDVATDYFNGISKGTSNSQKRITPQDFLDYKVILPPIAEQRAIAEALSDVDGLIAALDKKIAKKRLLKQGAMQQLLTGKKRLPGFTDEWVEKPIRLLCKLYGRIGFRGYTKADLVHKGEGAITFSPSDIHEQVISYTNCDYISWRKYDESPEIQVFNGDIIFCKTASIGKCAIITNLPEKATINPQFVVLKDFKCNNEWLYYSTIDRKFQTVVSGITGGSTIPTMSQEKLYEQTLLCPPTIEEQQAIATILSDMDKEIADLESQRDKYRLLKSGMMQKLLTGQIRLKTE